MQHFFSTIFTCMKYIVLAFVFLFVVLFLFNLVSSAVEVFRYSTLKKMTIRRISRYRVIVNVPVALSKKPSRNLPTLSVCTSVGDFGMYFDSSKKKIYFSLCRDLGFFCAFFDYGIADPAMENALFEEFHPLALSEKRYTK